MDLASPHLPSLAPPWQLIQCATMNPSPLPPPPCQVSYSDRLKRMAVLVSKLDHCLYDLLIRRDSGELNCTIPIIISNHPDLEGVAAK